MKGHGARPQTREARRSSRPVGIKLRKQRSSSRASAVSPDSRGSCHDLPVVGVGISFPGDRLNPTDGVEYEANLVYVGGELGDEDYD